jgi:hypothetical protein
MEEKPITERENAARKVALESGLSTHSQRRVNLIWEATQSIVAVSVTLATLVVAAVLALRQDHDVAAFVLLSNSFFLVVGFYFGRTNHTRTGGVQSQER